MKKSNKSIIIGIAGLIIVAAIAVIVFNSIGKKPFKNLTVNDIYSANVRLTPPDETVEIADIQKLVDTLREVVIYERDDSYMDYAGQSVVYTLKMKDSSEMVIGEYNPFIIINGLGYKTKYEPCEELNRMANELLQKKNSKFELNSIL